MHQERRRLPLHTKIFIGLILGAIAGVAVHLLFLGPGANVAPEQKKSVADFIANYVAPLGKVFLYLIFMVVVPLLLSALVLGVQELGQAGRMGRVGLRSLALTVLLSGIAVVIGLGAVNAIRPGDQLSAEKRAQVLASASKEKGEEQLKKAQDKKEDPPLLGFIPQNPIKEAARALDGGLLAFMFFALVFGMALAYIEQEKAMPVVAVFEGIFAMSLKVIEWALVLAPYGVFFLLFSSISQLGWELLGALALYAAVVLGALAVHQFVVYSIFLKAVARRSPREFFGQIKAVMLTAFATASSNATLPVALRSAERDVGLPKDISSFVLTVGATANQNGTALFEGVTILFLAQLYGVPLDLAQQVAIMGLAIVAGIGTAGVPGGSLPFVAAVLAMYGIPIEGIGIILGVDRILDMSRTVLNVTGDMTIAACVSAMEGRRQGPTAELVEVT